MEDIYDVPDVKNVTFGPLDEKHPFVDYGIGFELYGKKLGVLGYGAIGCEVAVKRAKALEWKSLHIIHTCRQRRSKQTEQELLIWSTTPAESDMISIHLPVLPSTKGIRNKDWFSKMKPTAYVINTARAAVIDQKDFVEALMNKRDRRCSC